MHVLGFEGFASPFEFLKVVLCQNVETIRDFGGTDEVSSLERIVKDFEKYLGEWCRLNSSDLTPFVEEELRHLSECMQKTYAEMQREVEAASQELKSLETEKVKISDAIIASNRALADANKQLEKEEAMIKRAKFLISKAGTLRTEEIARTTEC